MIAKTGSGKSFKGLASYLQEETKDARILVSDGVRTTTPEAMAFDFHQQAKNNERTVRSVGHDSLSFAQTDRNLSDKEMKNIALDYMKKMGYENTQFAVIRHNDRSHQHCHIIYNRVDNDGKTITDKFNYHKANKVCRELEKRHELTKVDGTLKTKEEKKTRDNVGLRTKIEQYKPTLIMENKDNQRSQDREKIERFEFEKEDSLDLKRDFLKAKTDEERLVIIQKVEQERGLQKEQNNDLLL